MSTFTVTKYIDSTYCDSDEITRVYLNDGQIEILLNKQLGITCISFDEFRNFDMYLYECLDLLHGRFTLITDFNIQVIFKFGVLYSFDIAIERSMKYIQENLNPSEFVYYIKSVLNVVKWRNTQIPNIRNILAVFQRFAFKNTHVLELLNDPDIQMDNNYLEILLVPCYLKQGISVLSHRCKASQVLNKTLLSLILANLKILLNGNLNFFKTHSDPIIEFTYLLTDLTEDVDSLKKLCEFQTDISRALVAGWNKIGKGERTDCDNYITFGKIIMSSNQVLSKHFWRKYDEDEILQIKNDIQFLEEHYYVEMIVDWMIYRLNQINKKPTDQLIRSLWNLIDYKAFTNIQYGYLDQFKNIIVQNFPTVNLSQTNNRHKNTRFYQNKSFELVASLREMKPINLKSFPKKKLVSVLFYNLDWRINKQSPTYKIQLNFNDLVGDLQIEVVSVLKQNKDAKENAEVIDLDRLKFDHWTLFYQSGEGWLEYCSVSMSKFTDVLSRLFASALLCDLALEYENYPLLHVFVTLLDK